jgi:hypothetical protein
MAAHARIPKAEISGVSGAIVKRMPARRPGALGPGALAICNAVANVMTRGNVALGVSSQGFADACAVTPA